MSTRSFIGVQRENGNIEAIYCHFDGCLDGVGKILFEHYQDPAKIDELIALGDISSLGEIVGEKIDFDSYGLREDGKKQVVAYHRDRGEELREPLICYTSDGYVRKAQDNGAEYAYLYRDGKWEYASLYGDIYAGAFQPISF